MGTTVTNLATNDTDLTNAVNDLLAADAAEWSAVEAEITNLKAVTFVPGVDPTITDSVSKIEALVTQKKANTAAALAAIAPAPAAPAPADPTPAAPVSDDPAPADQATPAAS